MTGSPSAVGAPRTQSIAAALPDYEISRELGRGAMGIVYLGRHRKLGRAVAVKELAATLADDPEVRSRFLTEARTLAALNHPHIVPIYDYVEHEGRCLLIMEALPGGTVWDLFAREGLSLEKACALTTSTCEAVQHAHEHGVLHRDIKPENLLLTADGVLKVADFGIAKMINGSRTLATMDGSVLGTPAYMAPEQAEGATVGPAADVYAIATMLYEFVSGRLPFEGDSPMSLLVQRITSDARPLATSAPSVPKAVADVIMRALARDPGQRIATPAALSAALADANGAVGASAAGYVAPLPPANGPTAATIAPRRGAVVPPPPLVDRVDPAARPPSEADWLDTGPAAVDEVDEFGRATKAATVAVAPSSAVRPVGEHHGPAFDAADLDRSQLVGIEAVIRPAAPLLRPLLLTVAAFAIAIGSLLTAPAMPRRAGGIAVVGRPVVATPNRAIAVDLARPFTISGLGGLRRVTAELTRFGLPVGSVDAPVRSGRAVIDFGKLGLAVHGPVLLTARAPSSRGAKGQSIALQSSRKPWRSGEIPVTLLVLAFALSSAEAQSRRHRKGRVRNGAVAAAATAGAIAMVAAVGLWSARVRQPVAFAPTMVAALASAVGFGALTVVRARRARRRRLRWKADR